MRTVDSGDDWPQLVWVQLFRSDWQSVLTNDRHGKYVDNLIKEVAAVAGGRFHTPTRSIPLDSKDVQGFKLIDRVPETDYRKITERLKREGIEQ